MAEITYTWHKDKYDAESIILSKGPFSERIYTNIPGKGIWKGSEKNMTIDTLEKNIARAFKWLKDIEVKTNA